MKLKFRDLHLEDIEDVSEITPKLLVKRATDAIVFKEDDVKDADWQFSYVYINYIVSLFRLNVSLFIETQTEYKTLNGFTFFAGTKPIHMNTSKKVFLSTMS